MKEYLASEFIVEEEIRAAMADGSEKVKDKENVRRILEKAKTCVGLTHREAAVLLNIEDKDRDIVYKNIQDMVNSGAYSDLVSSVISGKEFDSRDDAESCLGEIN